MAQHTRSAGVTEFVGWPAPNNHAPFAGTGGSRRSAAGMAPSLREAFRGSGYRGRLHRSRPKSLHVWAQMSESAG